MVKRIVLLAVGFSLVAPYSAEAQFGRLLREGFDAGVKQAGKLMGRGGKEAGKAGRKATRHAGSELPTAAPTSVLRESSQLASAQFARRFGVDGQRALAAVSPQGARQLAGMADELAASGRAGDWLRLIAQQGDSVVQWLWKRKGSIALGTAATAVLLAPEDFLRASGEVASVTLTTAGEHFVEPLIVSTAEHVAAPLVRTAVAPVGVAIWASVMAASVLVPLGWWNWKGRRWLARRGRRRRRKNTA